MVFIVQHYFSRRLGGPQKTAVANRGTDAFPPAALSQKLGGFPWRAPRLRV